MSSVMVEDDPRWKAFEARDAEADGAFVVAVVTTNVYCRPSCPAKRPLKRNVRFYTLAKEARAAGFRPCKRCRPDEISSAQRAALAVEAACSVLEARPAPPSLAELAAEAGMSPHHFHRTFKAHTGLTPRAYAEAARERRTRAALATGGGITEAAFEAGYASLSSFYEAVATRYGLKPGAIASGGHGELIITAQRAGPLGLVTAAFSERGVCSVVLTDNAQDGIGEVVSRFPRAQVIDGGADYEAALDHVLAAFEEPALAEALPLDVRGTAFEERVWAALRAIPAGTTKSYAELAASIGAPGAHRAVARACGANKIAVLIPCHRAVRADGSLAGYRWGLKRKQALIDGERVAADA